MIIQVRVAVSSGWLTFTGHAPAGSDRECYGLPSGASRAAFWSARMGYDIPDGRGLIWQVGCRV
jgi:hypothetical protein